MSTLSRALLAFGSICALASGCGPGADQVADSAPATSITSTSSATTSTSPAGAAETTPTTDRAEPASSAERWPSDPAGLDPSAPARWTVEVLSTAPHDPAAFTQGLERLDDGRLIESTGLRGFSDVRIVEPATGDVIRSAALESDEFGEGLTVVGDTLIQLTWQKEVARRWSLPDLAPLNSFTYDGEGWGLCLADDRLAMSDGSATLEWRDPSTFEVIETVIVSRRGSAVELLNELECVDGLVLANVWKTAEIVVIRADGVVVATIDASPLVDTVASDEPDREVLNGIAAEPDGTFSLTGKLWPTRFVVRLVEA